MCPKKTSQEPIAIVGSSCRFAGDATSPSKLWELLKEPRDIQTRIPDTRFNIDGYYHQDYAHHGHTNVQNAYLLNQDPATFDAEFFGISAMETKAIDPQQRMLLEIVHEALEDAGMSTEALRGSDTAVFVGIMCAEYESLLLRDLNTVPTYFASGVSRAILSNRISYLFDWHGASMTVDTACSSSLVAVHQAVQALRLGESRMAVACGANLILGPEAFIVESKVKMLSPDGRSRMWDKDANGYARGDGIAALILKPLSQALKDGDDVHCLIRETGISQDGATSGITMPSATAQKELIQSTFRKAGLDPYLAADRPQYFEAHGTGTPAGDPIESEAIRNAFFGEGSSPAGSYPLYVGSIKTVLGHTEGTAGIAGILKAALAMKNSTIPPNLLFDELSTSVAPHYKGLEICREAIPWPEPPNSQPRRASVNSFGFGGTHAHAILESYESPRTTSAVTERELLFVPFVFSAASEYSLRANLREYAAYIERHPAMAVYNISYTLRQRRSVFPYRAAFPASSAESLRANILAKLGNTENPVGIRTSAKGGQSSRILGVFTGQGAQYARMGAELLESSPLAQGIISKLEVYLANLPEEDRPDWSLKAELLRDSETSRLGEAVIAQPLCTALQILLVDILAEAGISFSAVVGHSSGEIAAAYAAGWLTARDALLVAYYRGLHSTAAKSPNGNVQGAMLAVGTSVEEILELCEDPEFAGRLALAASNSSSSVTVSGDVDAIHELQLVLDDEKKFHRMLKVDKAYHSTHMVPCAEPYIVSLRRAGVKPLEPTTSCCTWFSSVYGGRPVVSEFLLGDRYWAENMVQPVLFSEAITAAVSAGSRLDLALELGPHSTLQGPATQTIQEAIQKPLPYHGVLDRKKGAIEALSTSLGVMWSHLDVLSVNLNHCQLSLSAQNQPHMSLSRGLPTYQWNHQTRYWHESRRSKKMRLHRGPFHPLLGHISPDSASHQLRWTNILKPSELPWLTGHQVQKQIVFPASGYLSTAFEAARVLGEGRGAIRLIEVNGFHIHQAVSFDSEDASVEISIELAQVTQPRSTEVTAKFSYSAVLGSQATDFSLAATGDLKVYLGDVSSTLLPERAPSPPYLIPCQKSRLYGFMENLEYDFADHFRSLDSLERKLGNATCRAKRIVMHDSDSVMIHPVDLDAAFQSVILAYSYPGDDEIRTLQLPSSVFQVRINPALFVTKPSEGEHLTIDSTCTRADRASPSGFSGSVKVYRTGCAHAAIQLDRLSFKPVGSGGSDHRKIFHNMHLVPRVPDGLAAGEGILIAEDDVLRLRTLSRLGTYYLRIFNEQVPLSAPLRSEGPLSFYLAYAHHMMQLVRAGKYKYADPEWLNDSLEDVQKEIKERKIENNVAVKMATLVGETMPRVFNGETTMLEHLRISGLLDEYYANGIGTLETAAWLGGAVRQLTDRNPHLKILEVGAGTGGATKRILAGVGSNFHSYTFTDVSSSFFENAADTFAPWKDKMVFKVCDVEKDPLTQGFAAGEYDVVVASFILHATANLDRTVRNIRKLVRPGGYLVIGEATDDGPFQAGYGLIFGTLPGWWLGAEEGRSLSPLASASQWDAILRRTGFSGLDTTAPPDFFRVLGVVLGISQAVDDRVKFIREPLAGSLGRSKISKLVLVGGETGPVRSLVDELLSVLGNISEDIFAYKTLEQIDFAICHECATVLVLSELDYPIFNSLNPEKWHHFRELFVGQRTVLWVTTGRNDNEPYSNMVVGFGRTAANENEDLRVQFLDFPDLSKVDARTIAESLYVLYNTNLQGDDILFTAEPEVIIDETGRQLVPRLRQMPVLNDRYNSIQRPIVRDIDASHTVFELRQQESGSYCRPLSRFELEQQTTGRSDVLELKITHTSLSAVKTLAGYQFVALGVDSAERSYVTFTAAPKSRMQVRSELAVGCDMIDSSLPSAALVALFLAVSGTKAIVDPLLGGQGVLVHNPSEYAACVLSAYASVKGANITFTTDFEGPPASTASWICLPPFVASSDMHDVLPREVSCFVDLSTETSINVPIILSTLSPLTRVETSNSLFSRSPAGSSFSSTFLSETLTALVRDVSQIAAMIKSCSYPIETVNIGDVASGMRPENIFTVVDWAVAAPSLPMRVVRLDPKPILKDDRTYWLCGMSGGLGLSLCDWMIENGVNYLALTSRNPNIEVAWLDAHKKNNVTIEILSCDVTNQDALRAVHNHIVKTMPPIAGAVNGAMVLRDVSVGNMSLEDAEIAIRPKILGSIHLDRIFYEVNLDFFVLMSSMSGVIGTVGQANYAAANAGICSLAAQRRNRGLNSSCINVGMINGVGYITQSDRNLDDAMERLAAVHLSETDFHQSFVEAIEAGYPDSPNGPELTLGLKEIWSDAVNLPKWAPNPKFSHFVVKTAAEAEERSDQGSGAPLSEQLRACKSNEAVIAVINHAFCTQLRRILQQPTPDEELLQKDSTSLGLDSLISVDIRSWILKNFQVNIPVLTIMSSDVQMSRLAQLAAENIPAAMIPEVPNSTTMPNDISDLLDMKTDPSTELDSTASGDSPESSVTTTGRTPSKSGNKM